MCVTCGCPDGTQATIINPETGQAEPIAAGVHQHILADGTVMVHDHHYHGQEHESDHHNLHHSQGHPAAHAHSGHSDHYHDHDHHDQSHHDHSHVHTGDRTVVSTIASSSIHANLHGTTIELEQSLLAKNDGIAAQNRAGFKAKKILALNLVSSPGSGKTTLLTRTIQDLKGEIPISVIEGDQATANDADRIRETGCPVVQINTGTGCHLEAAMIDRGIQTLQPPDHSIVMIENVGNLVCPALFDLGEAAKVAILSVTEGEDKPIKYPHMFRASQIMLLTKIDLLPYVPFQVARCLAYAREVNPDIQIFSVSAHSGAGLTAWYEWLRWQMRSHH